MSAHNAPSALAAFLRQRAERPAPVRLRSPQLQPPDPKDQAAVHAAAMAWLERAQSYTEAANTQASELAELRAYLTAARSSDALPRRKAA